MKYRFEYTHKDSSMIFSFEADSIEEVVDVFKSFLISAGFHIDTVKEHINED